MDGWLEQRSRIPFAGIVAIVVIVAVVAVFLKAQMSTVFPPGDLTVQSSPTGNVVAESASDSFYGEREVPLQRKEYLAGIMNTPSGATSFRVDYGARLLLVTREETQEIQLVPVSDRLTATFTLESTQARVDIDGAARTLIFSEPGKAVPATIALAELVTYQGSFLHKERSYPIAITPGAGEATIQGATFPISKTEDGYHGIWAAGKQHSPVTIAGDFSTITIEELY
jgi:hypothetical protein